MRFRLWVAIVLFLLVEGGLIIYAFRQIEKIAQKKNISAFPWKARAFFSILGLGILAGLFAAGIMMLLEVELFWILIPMALAGFYAYFLMRKKLLKKENTDG